MKVIYLGQSYECLKYLINKNIQVMAIVVPSKDKIIKLAQKHKIPIFAERQIYKSLKNFKDVDLVLSCRFWKLLKKPLIELPRIGCINFHPAPLPKFRGMYVYNFAIYENVIRWGVTAHFVDETFDTGRIIKCVKFKINPKKETAFSLRARSHKALTKLFKEIVDTAYANKPLKSIPQGKGRYISKKDFEELRKISSKDSVKNINRKIRAFWCPPYHGAYIKIKGEEFTLINKEILKELYENFYSKKS